MTARQHTWSAVDVARISISQNKQ